MNPTDSGRSAYRRLAGIGSRILTEKSRELGIKFRMPGAESARALEERFCRHREELRRIRRAIGIEQSGRSRFFSGTKRLELLVHYFSPIPVLSASR